MLIFQNNTLETLCSYAKAEYPTECCGILLGLRKNGQRLVYNVIPTENTVAEKKNKVHFLIDPIAVLRAELSAERQQLEIVGFYHSHPDHDAVASYEDITYMITGYSYPIISVKNGSSVDVKCFQKALQTDTDAKEEIWVKEK